jgi:hypothetical protein
VENGKIYLAFVHVEIVYDNTNEEIQSEEGTEDDEQHEVQI